MGLLMVQANETNNKDGSISLDLRREASGSPYPHIPPDDLESLVRVGLPPSVLARLNEGHENLKRISDPGQRDYRETQLKIYRLEQILVATLNWKDGVIAEMGSEIATLKKQMGVLQARIGTLEEELEEVEKRRDSIGSVG